MSVNEKITFEYDDEDGGTENIELPAKYIVCPRCEGKGVHDHPAFYNGFTRNDEWVDDEFIENYMEGHYDVRCEECNGDRVVLVPDKQRCIPAEYRKWERHQQEEYEYRAMVESERRMGA